VPPDVFMRCWGSSEPSRTGGLDVERIKNERKARQLQAQSVLNEFEVEMGLKKPDATREAAPFPTQSTAGSTPQKLPEAG